MTSQSSQSQSIHPKLAPVARLVWYLVALSVLLFYLFSVIQYHAQNYPVSEQVSEALNRFGLAGELYVYVNIVADVILVGAFMAMGFLMYWRRGNVPIVYIASLTMVSLTHIFTGLTFFVSRVTNGDWLLYLGMVLSFIANSLILLVVYALPDGSFNPKWTRWAFLLSIVYLIAFYASVDFWTIEFNIVSRILVFLLPAIGLQLYRYRHVSNPSQRQQTKWVLLGIAIAGIAFFMQNVPAQLMPYNSPEAILYRLISLPIRNLFLIALPLGFGFAALRYRLWDVDLTLNRSLVLALLTLLLGLLFALVFFIAHNLLNLIFPANHQMISGSIAAIITLVAFNPSRRLVRRLIDRRFYGFRFDLNDLRSAQLRVQEKASRGTYSDREIEGYRLGNLIGRGGMGEIYEGISASHPVAIKTLPASAFGDETARRRFEREAQATKSINHPNIVKVLGSGFTNDLAYIILEYVTGEDLRALIAERGALPLKDSLSILTGLAAALDAVHQQGIIHRDLKPSNVMLPRAANGESYQPILVDFGLARIDSVGTSLTGSGAIGTVAYMSPEQFIESRSVDFHADIYALGVIAYEMLAGKPPFEGQVGHIMFAHIQQPPPDLRELRPEIAPHIAQAIQKAMAKNASERYDSASDFVVALGV